MRRRHVWFLAVPVMVFLVVLADGNRTNADGRPGLTDQTVDFRLNQIMVKLSQIEWELSQIRNRLRSRDQRLDDIDRQLDRILEEMEDVTPTKSATSTSATDPALFGTWRLSRNDFADEIPENIRRYLEAQADQADQRDRADRIRRNIAKNVSTVIDSFEVFLDQTGFLLLRFEPDGLYTDSTGDEGMWLVSESRLIMTTFDGRTYPSTYSVDGADLTLTLTGDQIGTLLLLEAERTGARDRRLIANSFRYTDRVRLFYTKE